MSGKGSGRRPNQVPLEQVHQSFDRIFGITCKRCGKKLLEPLGIHTCSPQVKDKANEAMDSAAGSRLPASETANRDGEVSQQAGLPETVQD